MNPFTQTEEEVEVLEVVTEQRDLILYNDDFNTFDHVIDCLVAICNHELLQAEQCAHLVHFTGKCAVKKGEFSKLKPMKEALAEQGLSVVIE